METGRDDAAGGGGTGQATVYRYDPATGAGAVLTDSGEVLPFGPEALRHSGLRHLRPGQRLTLTRSGDGGVRGLRLGTIGDLTTGRDRPVTGGDGF